MKTKWYFSEYDNMSLTLVTPLAVTGQKRRGRFAM